MNELVLKGGFLPDAVIPWRVARQPRTLGGRLRSCPPASACRPPPPPLLRSVGHPTSLSGDGGGVPSSNTAAACPERAGGALCAAKYRRRGRPQGDAGGHGRSRGPRRPA